MELQDIFEMAKKIEPKKKIAVAVAQDEVVLKAVNNAVENGICNAVLFGDKEEIEKIAKKENINLSNFEIRDYKNKKEAIKNAVESVSKGETDLPMKGKCTTGELLSVFLKEEYGLRTKNTMNLVSVFEIPTYHKLLIVSDAGMLIAPTLQQKIDEVNNAVAVAHKIGIETPKVAIVGAVEQVNTKMVATTDAAIITQMNRRNQIKGCIVDGPFAMDNAISKEAAEHKGIVSDVAGDADIIIMPQIEAGNIFYKSMVFLGNSKVASTILGGKKPVVLTSRADSDEAKLNSIAISVLMA
ncbi:phosphate acetyltransferase [Tepiditoga spiralis]|uniref:Phosphate acetyltransferase n=2 Tax=Tepiditoga spiralis TaxID=2108365 RepID=A0A7G1G7Q8_9BACT|nr:bifunctional enoyl-CoA hydratase/phosphate acetyltransferase [Tepiditoga spiralis]BBE30052.1 phosphate acetyltransferase [Tepiditoga spiralis]